MRETLIERKRLKSPQAAPYVLLVLMIYFGFRTTIEWYQNDARRRRLPASRIDFMVAHAIAAAALVLYGFQSLSKIQVANTIDPARFTFFTLGLAFGSMGFLNLSRLPHLIDEWREDKFEAFNTVVMGLLSLAMIALTLFAAVTRHDFSVLIVAGIGFVVGLTITLLIRRITVGEITLFDGQRKRRRMIS